MSLRYPMPKSPVKTGRNYRLASLAHEDSRYYGHIVKVEAVHAGLATIKTHDKSIQVAIADLRNVNPY